MLWFSEVMCFPPCLLILLTNYSQFGFALLFVFLHGFPLAWRWLAAGAVPGARWAETGRASDRVRWERHSAWLSDRSGRKGPATTAAADLPALLSWPAARRERARPFTARHLRLRDPRQPGLCLHRGRRLLHGHWNWPLWRAWAIPQWRRQPPPPGSASWQTGLLGRRRRRARPGKPEPPTNAEPDAAAWTCQAAGALLPGPCGHRGKHEPQQESRWLGEGRLHPLNMHHNHRGKEAAEKTENGGRRGEGEVHVLCSEETEVRVWGHASQANKLTCLHPSTM